jgi:hypothetical protein
VTLSAAAADRANRDATLHPVTDPGTLPAVDVAGAMVFAYFDASGTLCVSVSLDTVAADATDDRGCVPMRVTVGDTDVFTG